MDVIEEGWLRVHDAVLNWKKLKSKTNHSLWILYFLFPLSISSFFIIILADLFLAGPTFFLGGGGEIKLLSWIGFFLPLKKKTLSKSSVFQSFFRNVPRVT